MNRYGTEALEHWRAYLSASYGRLEDPVRFFTELGEQADAEVEDRYLEYAGPDIPGESAEDKQARLTQAMNRASEEVFAELVTPRVRRCCDHDRYTMLAPMATALPTSDAGPPSE